MKHILKCKKCNTYTLKSSCCNDETISPRPAKFSPEDRYGSYRRKAKTPSLKEKGLI